MVPPKLVAFDVDGTLLDHHGSCTDRTRETLARLRDAGVTTAIATGRPRAPLIETIRREIPEGARRPSCTTTRGWRNGVSHTESRSVGTT